MSLFKRIRTTISASVNQLVGEIENHDAVMEAAINESRRATAQAKVRLSRTERERAQLQQKIADVEAKRQKWRERALACADNEESKALSCLQQEKNCAGQISQLTSILKQQDALLAKLRSDIGKAESKLAQINHQRNMMRSRESAATALNAMAHADIADSININDTLERWEAKIIEAELELETQQPLDDFEYQFTEQENLDELRAELRSLKQQGDQPQHGKAQTGGEL